MPLTLLGMELEATSLVPAGSPLRRERDLAPAGPPALARHRLPQGQPGVARRSDLDALRRKVNRGPVSLVLGARDSGKTDLIVDLVRSHFPELHKSTVYVKVDGSLSAALLGALREMARATGARGIDWTLAGRSRSALVETALALSEANGAPWIWVVDDLEHAGPERDDLIIKIANYARSSRWIFAGDLPLPPPGLDDQALYIDG